MQKLDIYSPVKHSHLFGEFTDVAARCGDIMTLGGMIADGRYVGLAEALEVVAERAIREIEQLCAEVRAHEAQQTMFHAKRIAG